MKAAVTLLSLLLAFRVAAQRSVVLTFDDLPDIAAGEDSVATEEAITRSITSVLSRHGIRAAGFVNEDKLLDDDGKPDPRAIALIEQWLRAGMTIGNHTYSHLSVNAAGADRFEQDVIQGEVLTTPLLARYGQRERWFRFPYLETGADEQTRQRVAGFLAARGYTNAPVTIDDSEWIYDEAYRRAIPMRPFIASSYIRYMQARFAWSEEKSRLVFGREIPQAVLLHASLLNARALEELIAMIERRGYHFVPLAEALRDPAYSTEESWVGGGVTWLQRWGMARGLPIDAFANDPRVPRWVDLLAREREAS